MARGEFVAPLDADSYVSPFSLSRMMAHFDSGSVAAVAAGVQVPKAKNWIENLQRLEYMYAIFSRKVVNCIDAVQVTPGPFSVFRRKTLVAIGGFDVHSMVEDQEVALRLQEHGYRINSCIDCCVYTEVPDNFTELMKQRTRWQRGGFWNSMKYLHLIKPEFGDFGVLVLPYGVFGYFVLLFWLGLSVYSLLSISPYTDFIGLKWFILNLGPFHILMLVGVAIYLFWFLFGIKRMFSDQKLGAGNVLLFFFLYPMFLTFFWITAAYTELKTKGRFEW
jgi:biofilm PGA synthesis N-glycosyltransferase PgaC